MMTEFKPEFLKDGKIISQNTLRIPDLVTNHLDFWDYALTEDGINKSDNYQDIKEIVSQGHTLLDTLDIIRDKYEAGSYQYKDMVKILRDYYTYDLTPVFQDLTPINYHYTSSPGDGTLMLQLFVPPRLKVPLS